MMRSVLSEASRACADKKVGNRMNQIYDFFVLFDYII